MSGDGFGHTQVISLYLELTLNKTCLQLPTATNCCSSLEYVSELPELSIKRWKMVKKGDKCKEVWRIQIHLETLISQPSRKLLYFLILNMSVCKLLWHCRNVFSTQDRVLDCLCLLSLRCISKQTELNHFLKRSIHFSVGLSAQSVVITSHWVTHPVSRQRISENVICSYGSLRTNQWLWITHSGITFTGIHSVTEGEIQVISFAGGNESSLGGNIIDSVGKLPQQKQNMSPVAYWNKQQLRKLCVSNYR